MVTQERGLWLLGGLPWLGYWAALPSVLLIWVGDGGRRVLGTRQECVWSPTLQRLPAQPCVGSSPAPWGLHTPPLSPRKCPAFPWSAPWCTLSPSYFLLPSRSVQVQIDPYLEDALCHFCNSQPGPFFCRDQVRPLGPGGV